MDAKQRLKHIEIRMKKNRELRRHHVILFLDFDGVVNVPYRYGSPEYEAAMEQGVYDFFRPEIVERLNRLIHEYHLSVVISSSWRYSGIRFCQDSLWNAGFDRDVVIEGLTVLSEGIPPRHEEILDYLESVGDLTGFLILDDINMHELSGYAVQTVFEDGYTEACDQHARMILEREIDVKENHRLSAVIVIFIVLVILVFVLLAGRGTT